MGTTGTAKDAAPARGRRRWLRRAGFAAYVLLATLLLAEVGLRLMTQERAGQLVLLGSTLLPFDLVPEGHAAILRLSPEECPYVMPDPDLGWTIKPGGRHPSKPFAANPLGLRSSADDHEVCPAEGPVRVLLVGDSFTHGDELEWPDTWAARLAERLGPSFQVHNGGVPGYGTDQAFLRWKAHLKDRIRPEVVVLGIVRDDLWRNVNLFRALYHHWTDLPWSKPRFVLDGDGLRLVNAPVVPPEEVEATLAGFRASPLRPFDSCFRPRYYEDDVRYASRLWRLLLSRREHGRRHDAMKALVGEGGEATEVTARIARLFQDEVRAAGARPVVLLLPQHDDVPSYVAGGHPPLRFLKAAMERRGVVPVDAGPAFHAALGPGEAAGALFVGGAGHPNARGARLIAEVVERAVRGG